MLTAIGRPCWAAVVLGPVIGVVVVIATCIAVAVASVLLSTAHAKSLVLKKLACGMQAMASFATDVALSVGADMVATANALLLGLELPVSIGTVRLSVPCGIAVRLLIVIGGWPISIRGLRALVVLIALTWQMLMACPRVIGPCSVCLTYVVGIVIGLCP